MPRVKGVISILFGDDYDDLVGLKNAVLSWTNEPINHANIGNLGWSGSTPGVSNWNVSASANTILDDDDDAFVNAAQAAIEILAFEKTEFATKFVAENGAIYFGSCFITSYRTQSADQTTLGFSVEMQGSGVLIEIGESGSNLDWLPCDGGYWQIYGSQRVQYLGYNEGWVRYTYTGGAPGNLVIKDGNLNTIHSVVGWGPGYTLETFFYWDPLPGDSPTITTWVTTYNPPLYPAQTATICGPGVYEPTT